MSDVCRYCRHHLIWNKVLNCYCSTGAHHTFGKICEKGPGIGHSPLEPGDPVSVERFLDG